MESRHAAKAICLSNVETKTLLEPPISRGAEAPQDTATAGPSAEHEARLVVGSPHVDLIHLIRGLAPRLEVLPRPVDVTARVSELRVHVSRSIGNGWMGAKSYHVAPEIFFLLALEPLEVFEHAGAGVFDVFLGHFEGLFELQM